MEKLNKIYLLLGLLYQLIEIKEVIDKHGVRGFVENIFLDNLDSDYKIYLFYIPGPNAGQYDQFQKKLNEYGQKSGKNLLINTLYGDDPQFNKIIGRFDIKKYPVVIITGVDAIVSFKTETQQNSTIFVKIDNTHFFEKTERALSALSEIYTYFLNNNVKNAIKEAKKSERSAVLSYIKRVLVDRIERCRIRNLCFCRYF